MLLKVFHSQTRTPVRFAEATVEFSAPELFHHPLVYLTGTNAFSLNATERGNLRAYLQRGGVLLAEAACGRPSFDEAFRREMALALPKAKLSALPPDHRVFCFPRRIGSVMPSPALARQLSSSGRIKPTLYGATIENRLCVIYSPFDLSGGWALAHGPYDEGLASEDALALG